MVAIGTRVAGVRVGAIAGLLGAFHPLLMWYSSRLQYEYLLTLLLALAILWFLKMTDSGSRLDAVGIGLLLGAASLVNQVVILLPLALWTALFLMWARKAETLFLASITLLTMAAVILPWTARNYLVSGRFIPVHSGGITQFVKGNFEFEFYAQAPLRSVEIARISEAHLAQVLTLPEQLDVRDEGMDQLLLPHAIAFLRDEPQSMVWKIAGQFPRFWYLSETPLKSYALLAIQLPLLALALMGAVHLLLTKHRPPISVAILLVTIAYFNLVYAATHVEGRYSTPILPFVIVLAAIALAAAIERIRDRQLLTPSKSMIRAR
jgi:4-amino-4-deoxy-L-arabinose transferase-like glycosyltransferase